MRLSCPRCPPFLPREVKLDTSPVFPELGFEPTPPFVLLPPTCIRHCHPIYNGLAEKMSKAKNYHFGDKIFLLGCFFVPHFVQKSLCSTPLGLTGITRPQLMSAIVRRSCTQMCSEASYALSRLKKLEARGSSRHTVVIGHEHWSCVAT